MALDDSGRGYETFEHTADLGLLARGRSLPDLLELAALGLCRTMFEGSAGEAESRTVVAEGDEPEDLLVAWLDEIVFAFDVDNFVSERAVVDELAAGTVRGRLLGRHNDGGAGVVAHRVKAVTYHDLAIRQVGGLLEARVVLDV